MAQHFTFHATNRRSGTKPNGRLRRRNRIGTQSPSAPATTTTTTKPDDKAETNLQPEIFAAHI